ncbi:MAG: beta-propeller repeat protein [Ignavibacteria bacterium]|nr:beta-propeller repeat protein [Ignavibacteria bacterium]
MKHKIFFTILVLILISCTQDEKIIDNSKETWNILIATDNTQLKILEMPSGKLSGEDIYFANNGEMLPGKVETIKEFRDTIYLIIPSAYKIIVVDSKKFKKITVIDFSTEGKIPSDICFPNATDGYVCHGNDSTVTLIDLTNFIKARVIKTGRNPISIACCGNKIFTANRGDNTVSIIDSRIPDVVATLPVADNPAFSACNNGWNAAIISLGAGKDGDLKPKSEAKITFIDLVKFTIISSLDIGFGALKAIDQVPSGLAITPDNIGFIPTNNAFFRLDTRLQERMQMLSYTKILMINYNYKRNELLLVRTDGEGYQVVVSDIFTGKDKFVVDVTEKIISYLAL